jgi:hypothetical protein
MRAADVRQCPSMMRTSVLNTLERAIVLLLLLPAAVAFGARGTSDRGSSPRAGRKPGTVIHRASSHEHADATMVLLGDTVVEWQYDSLLAGQAEAFRLRAAASGVARAVHVYVSATSAAGTLIAGLYSSVAGHPAALLSAGTSSAPRASAWNAVSIAPIELRAGRTYWLAILGRGGKLRYRDRPRGSCLSKTSARRDLRVLPDAWRTGRTYSDCPVSAYVSAAPISASVHVSALGPTLAEPLVLGGEPPGPVPGAPVATEPPSISGNASEGQVLVAHAGTWSGSPSRFAYQWEDCNTAGASCTEIAGASSATYKLSAGDVGHRLRVGVTATNALGATEAFSPATGVIVSGPQIYVSQAGGAHGESGEDCENAHSLAWLNAAAHWGTGSGKVGAGTTVSICGTLTEAITVAASGKSGELITLRFQPGARISMPACPESGCIDTAEHAYLNIEGDSESEHGVIENTDQGTGKKEEGSAVNAHGIEALDCEGCTIRYMSIEKLYEKTSEADTTSAEPIRGIEFSGSNLTIAHNTLNYVGWALYSEWNREDKDVDIEDNTLTHIGHGFASTAAFTGGNIGPISFHGNRLYGFKAWDTVGDPNHQDGVHCYSSHDAVYQPHYNGLYIYDNRFGPETGKYMNASIFIEGPAEETQCGDGTSNIWIFDNVSVMNEESALGGIYTESGEDHVFNNTIIGPGTEEGESKNPCILIHGGERVRLENNLASTCDKLIEGEAGTFASGGLNYNLYADGGGAAWICGGEQKPFTEFAYWQSCTGQDSDSRARASAGIKVTPAEEAGRLEAGSPARGAGTNLTGLCEPGKPTEALCENINGEARPSAGAWNVGAY